MDGLTNGFTLGVPRGALKGKRIFRNYPPAFDARDQVTDAIASRVAASKTLHLGPWALVERALYDCIDDFCCFPMGCVPKPHAPEEMRPTSDHSRTGWNAATVMDVLGHTLDTYKRVSWLLEKNTFMYVSDVANAFMIIPLAPWVWWFFLLRCFRSRLANLEDGYMHLFADFGSRGMPGTFKIFFVDVVIQMARSEMIVTLPMVVHVDDVALIDVSADAVNEEMFDFQTWSQEVCGIGWKQSKDKRAAQLQLFCGFWWDTRTLHIFLD